MRKKFCIFMSFVAVLGLVSAAVAQTTLEAPKGNIVVNGDLNDWAMLPCCPEGPNCQSYQMSVYGNLAASLSYAWDDDNLYILLQEYVVDDDPEEGSGWETSPWLYDGVALFRRFGDDVGDADAPRQDFWMALTSDGAQRLSSRVNEPDPFDYLTSSAHGISNGLRYVEASVPMSYVLPDPPEVCTTFYLSPLYCDGPWSGIGQEMIGGEFTPGNQDPSDRTYVHLCPEPTTLILLGLGGLLLRRRRA